MLFETCIYLGQDPSNLQKLVLKAGDLRVSQDASEAWAGEHCCDVVFAMAGEEECIVVSAASRFHCVSMVLAHCREWVRSVIEGVASAKLYLEVEGEYRELSLDLIFATNDCVTGEMQDKLDFADANGYHEDWQSAAVIEPRVGRVYDLALTSDFGQIQIFDESFDEEDLPEWDADAQRHFACFLNGVVFLKVMENEDHVIGFELCEQAPSDEFDAFLQVVDVPFVTTGVFEVAGQPVKVPAGRYALRWFVSQAEAGEWAYQIKMWPKHARKVSVRKRYLLEG